ncbi:MAG TPA: hypothetical protein PL106_04930 [Flavobacteriales bacterium]|nr:hypothetical protein [Flavobacteriales bacterium]HNM69020.1 hypothetical protein [Flavobacteriales bacterium]
MKCLLLAPTRYPFIRSIGAGLHANGLEVVQVDFRDLFGTTTNALNDKYSSLPRRVRRLWEDPYVRRTNQEYLRIFRELKPDLVFIYNDQLLRPETVNAFKEQARVAFYLGDHPLYTPTNPYNLSILSASSCTITPDSFWCEQLTRMGLKNTVVDHFGINPEVHHPVEPTAEQRADLGADLVYIGSASKTNWGYKRARFLDLFSGMDLRAWITGPMDRWYREFPALATKVRPHARFDAAFNNLVYNCAKLAPVELVPSLFHGIHVRVFDVLGAGIMPLCEYSRDLEAVFGETGMPLIRDYREAADLARHWIGADDERKGTVERMRAVAIARYAPELVIRRLLERIFPAWH